MTKKTAPVRPYVLHFSLGHSQYVPQNAMCLLWTRSRRVQLSEYAEPTAKSSKLSMFASFGEDGAKHLASKSYQVRTCVLCLRRSGVVWLSLTQFLLYSRSPMGTQQCLRSEFFLMGPAYRCPPPSPIRSPAQTQVHWARIRTVSRHSVRHSRAVFN